MYFSPRCHGEWMALADFTGEGYNIVFKWHCRKCDRYAQETYADAIRRAEKELQEYKVVGMVRQSGKRQTQEATV